jgi:LysM repeat protein
MSTEYTVTADDTLEKISLAHDLTTSELMRANRLQTRVLYTGQRLRIPDPKQPLPTSSLPTGWWSFVL